MTLPRGQQWVCTSMCDGHSADAEPPSIPSASTSSRRWRTTRRIIDPNVPSYRWTIFLPCNCDGHSMGCCCKPVQATWVGGSAFPRGVPWLERRSSTCGAVGATTPCQAFRDGKGVPQKSLPPRKTGKTARSGLLVGLALWTEKEGCRVEGGNFEAWGRTLFGAKLVHLTLQVDDRGWELC